MFGLTSKKGFTLIELLIAITIIGILSATLIPRIANVLPTARDGARKASMNDIVAAVEAFNLDYGTYPKKAFCLNDADLAAPVNPTLYTKADDTAYTVTDFLSDYLRSSAPTHKAANDAATDCAAGNQQSIKYTPNPVDTPTGYTIGVKVEQAKNGNSTAIGTEGSADTGAYYTITR